MGNHLKTAAGSVHWKDYGGTGDLIVLVHGLGGSIANWDAIGPGLTDHGRTVALDLPGFGYSPPGPDWEVSTHAEAVWAFISTLGHSATLIGNSMGSLLSEMVAAEHPSNVEGLVLLSPATPARLGDPKIHWPTARRLAVQATPGVGRAVTRHFMRNLTPEELVRMTLDTVVHKPARVPLDMIESFVQLAEARSKLPWAEEAVPKTATSIAKLLSRRSRFVRMIREIKAPTLVVHGIEDRIVSPNSVEWLCSLRPDWELIQLEDTGHTPQVDAPVRLLKTISPWLEERRRSEITA